MTTPISYRGKRGREADLSSSHIEDSSAASSSSVAARALEETQQPSTLGIKVRKVEPMPAASSSNAPGGAVSAAGLPVLFQGVASSALEASEDIEEQAACDVEKIITALSDGDPFNGEEEMLQRIFEQGKIDISHESYEKVLALCEEQSAAFDNFINKRSYRNAPVYLHPLLARIIAKQEALTAPRSPEEEAAFKRVAERSIRTLFLFKVSKETLEIATRFFSTFGSFIPLVIQESVLATSALPQISRLRSRRAQEHCHSLQSRNLRSLLAIPRFLNPSRYISSDCLDECFFELINRSSPGKQENTEGSYYSSYINMCNLFLSDALFPRLSQGALGKALIASSSCLQPELVERILEKGGDRISPTALSTAFAEIGKNLQKCDSWEEIFPFEDAVGAEAQEWGYGFAGRIVNALFAAAEKIPNALVRREVFKKAAFSFLKEDYWVETLKIVGVGKIIGYCNAQGWLHAAQEIDAAWKSPEWFGLVKEIAEECGLQEQMALVENMEAASQPQGWLDLIEAIGAISGLERGGAEEIEESDVEELNHEEHNE